MVKKVKKVTIDGLARMVARGFEETSKKADVDRQFQDVGQQLKSIGDRLDSLEKEMANLKDLVILNLKRRVEGLEVEIKEFKNLIGMK
ncbi:MAG: hypothetical protein HYT38_01665 [Candidatus Sungbacteria bacterium]|uniref:Uncharacterized protein n=1 Tax=Candidatus Sungiibacteriota bacterium TaxID=2750080 RepID=A0A9D6HQZ9_9BACT|nr:hypothetical protein [Candidatus Sungbacteria bacterium]